jgi:hypothetical protein
MATQSIGDSQPVVVLPPGGNCCAPMADPGLTIPQRGGLTDFEMASAIVGASIDQEAVSPSGGLELGRQANLKETRKVLSTC